MLSQLYVCEQRPGDQAQSQRKITINIVICPLILAGRPRADTRLCDAPPHRARSPCGGAAVVLDPKTGQSARACAARRAPGGCVLPHHQPHLPPVSRYVAFFFLHVIYLC